MVYFALIKVLFFAKFVDSKMEAFIIGGEETKIKFYPHSIYLKFICQEDYMCGGSILNQRVVLTAAHCLEECTKNQIKEGAYLKFGHERLNSMGSIRLADSVAHEHYHPSLMRNDVAIVTTRRPISLGTSARRVALYRRTPINVKMAYIAGWGVMNNLEMTSQILLATKQEVHKPSVCRMYLGSTPAGTFCAGPLDGPGAPNRGDSGSALIVKEYIQIGLVSYKLGKYSLVVYTNVSYHYDWIKQTSLKLACKIKGK